VVSSRLKVETVNRLTGRRRLLTVAAAASFAGVEREAKLV
jgi:hypothetical protein